MEDQDQAYRLTDHGLDLLDRVIEQVDAGYSLSDIAWMSGWSDKYGKDQAVLMVRVLLAFAEHPACERED